MYEKYYNSVDNMFCEPISYKFRLLKNEVLFERVTTVIFCVAIILVGACSLADEANVPSPLDKSEQADPFSENGRKAGDRAVKVVNGVEFVFRWRPPGTFTMGSPESEEGRKSDEIQHQVTLTKGFWMMETEVTQEQWEAVMNKNNSYLNDDKFPVKRVTWKDCQEFCIKCADLGLPMQLPTEAQWEYACRAGTTGAYAGNLDEMGWYNSNSGYRTHLVGKKKPNGWGLYDMHGNVAEWCLDCYGAYPNGSATDPVVSSDESKHIYRGGGRRSSAPDCRSACRDYGADHYFDSRGFRCVINP